MLVCARMFHKAIKFLPVAEQKNTMGLLQYLDLLKAIRCMSPTGLIASASTNWKVKLPAEFGDWPTKMTAEKRRD